jgi:hypothetical protein
MWDAPACRSGGGSDFSLVLLVRLESAVGGTLCGNLGQPSCSLVTPLLSGALAHAERRAPESAACGIPFGPCADNR